MTSEIHLGDSKGFAAFVNFWEEVSQSLILVRFVKRYRESF